MCEKIDKKKLYFSLLFFIILFVLAIIYLILIHYGFIIPCVFHELTGLYCPGCGATRMIVSLLQFDFYQAFRFNPLLFCFLPFLSFIAILEYKNWLFGHKKVLVDNKVWIFLLIITILFGILRNLELFSFLAPTLIV